MSGVSGRRVVVAGATSESGAAVCAALRAAGAEVVAVGSDAGRLDALAGRVPGIRTEVCDLADPAAVTALAARLASGERSGVDGVDSTGGRSTAASDGVDSTSGHGTVAGDGVGFTGNRGGADGGEVDGVVHLVGGWVGGEGLLGQTDAGWERMERSFRSLRNTARAFLPALTASPAGRFAFVSSVSVDAPTASGADYTAAKAASESWMRSLADAFRTAQGDEPRAAAVTFAVKALVDDRMRAAAPDRRFPGFTDVATLAAAVVALWDSPAAALNGTRRSLVPDSGESS